MCAIFKRYFEIEARVKANTCHNITYARSTLKPILLKKNNKHYTNSDYTEKFMEFKRQFCQKLSSKQ